MCRGLAAGLAVVAALAPANLLAVEPVGQATRASITQKGSLLMFPHVEIKWGANGQLRQDTVLELSNDYPDDIQVQFYFVNGDEPLEAVYAADGTTLIERAHPGWNWVDNQLPLTANEPTYFSLATGLPKGTSSLSILDPGHPVGRPDPDPDNPGGRVVRGYVVGWAVDRAGHEVRWNHLTGTSLIVDYALTASWAYEAWAFQAQGVDHGDEPVSCLVYNLDNGQCVDSQTAPGRIDMDGYEYDACPGRLQFQFRTAGTPLRNPNPGMPAVQVDSRLTLGLCGSDLRQETNGPTTTKAKFDIWNENEVRFSGTERCITCWDQSSLATYTAFGLPNHFLGANLHTDTGRARVNGVASVLCDKNGIRSVDAAVLGIMHKVLRFPTPGTEGFEEGLEGFRIEKSGVALGGQGDEVAQILYDLVLPPQEAHDGNGQ